MPEFGPTLPSLPGGLSVIVPAYNSAETLPALAARLATVLEPLRPACELILVDDGSSDGTWDAIDRLAARHDWVHGLRLMRNSGQHNALLAGLRAARFDVVATLDDDLQHPPEELPVLLRGLHDGCDVVYGTPAQQQHGVLRDFASVVTKLALGTVMGEKTARKVSAFRVFRTRLRDAFALYSGPYVNLDVLLSWGTTRFGAIQVHHEIRSVGASKYTLRKLVRHTLNMLTGFSVLPLQLASVVGFVVMLFGVGVLVYVLGRYFLTGSTVAGFPFLASIIAIFSGTQLFALGVIGEYLARMHFRLMEKPTYTIAALTIPRAGDRQVNRGP
jgi:undecaprenyl-phosphate 4-deoxy-4-formamido-L-arabinose transferase